MGDAPIHCITADNRENLLRFSHDDHLFRYVLIVREIEATCHTLKPETAGHWIRQRLWLENVTWMYDPMCARTSILILVSWSRYTSLLWLKAGLPVKQTRPLVPFLTRMIDVIPFIKHRSSFAPIIAQPNLFIRLFFTSLHAIYSTKYWFFRFRLIMRMCWFASIQDSRGQFN